MNDLAYRRFGRIFDDGLESGTLLTSESPAGKWSNRIGVGTTIVVAGVEGSTTHHGAYRLQAYVPGVVAGQQGLANVNLQVAGSNVANVGYARWYVKLTALPPNAGDRVYLGELIGYNALYGVEPYIEKSYRLVLRWGLRSYEDSVATGKIVDTTGTGTVPAPLADHWYCLEVLRDITNGQQQLWIDGSLEASQPRAITTPNSALRVGISGNIGNKRKEKRKGEKKK